MHPFKIIYFSVFQCIHTALQPLPLSDFQTFSRLKHEHQHSFPVSSHIYLPVPSHLLATINLPSVSVDMPILDVSCKCVCLCSLGMFSKFIMYKYFQIAFYCMTVPHLIYSSVNKHLYLLVQICFTKTFVSTFWLL